MPGAEEYEPGKEIAFLKILYAHCAESSPFVLKDVIARARGNIERMELYDQDNVKNKFDLILEKIPSWKEDTKLNELFQILDKYKDTERILLFAQFKETVRYLKEKLSNRYKKRRVSIVTGDLSKQQREKNN